MDVLIKESFLNLSDSTAIISIDAYGKVIRYTKEDFNSPEEFIRTKLESDKSYRRILKQYERETHKKTSFESLSQDVISVDSAEDTYLSNERQRQMLFDLNTIVKDMRLKLTGTERRRLLAAINGDTEEKIAQRELVSQQNVSKSIINARKKLKRP